MVAVSKSLARSGVTIFTDDSQVRGSFGIGQDPICDIYEVRMVASSSDISPFARRTSPYALTYPPYDRIAGNRQTLGSGNLDSPPFLEYELDATCGKLTLYSTTNPDALVYQPSPTDIVSLNLAPDAGGDCVSVNYVPKGTGVNVLGNDAPAFDVYVFYCNIRHTSGFARFGISESTVMSDAWGRACIGGHLRIGETWGVGRSYLYPAYALSASPTSQLAHNFRITPSASRALTFSDAAAHSGPSWSFLKTTNGAFIDQDVVCPLGVSRSVSNSAYSFTGFNLRKRWLVPGATHYFYNTGLAMFGDEQFLIFYINACGKTINPGGTSLSVTKKGGTSGDYFFTGTFAAPSKAVAYYLLCTTPSDPLFFGDPFGYNHNTINPHYASEYGDFLPGLYVKCSVTSGDFP